MFGILILNQSWIQWMRNSCLGKGTKLGYGKPIVRMVIFNFDGHLERYVKCVKHWGHVCRGWYVTHIDI